MTDIIEYDCEQGSPEWGNLRLGLPTASMYAALLADGKGRGPGGKSMMRATYMRKLAGEIITGQPMESYSNAHMERGKEYEPEARERYAFIKGCELRRVGFIRRGRTGYSPDALVDDDGTLEAKSMQPDLLIELHESGGFPGKYIAQCQGSLLVTGRAWCDLAIYWPGMPMWIQRMNRDEFYIAYLRGEIDRFNDELFVLVEKIKRIGMPVGRAA